MTAGGFTPGLQEKQSWEYSQVSFLADRHVRTKMGGITLDPALVPADAEGRRIIKGGTALGEVTTTGLYGPYDNTATDGRGKCKGLLYPGDLDLQYGKTVAALLHGGSVLRARCTGIDDSAVDDLKGAVIFQ